MLVEYWKRLEVKVFFLKKKTILLSQAIMYIKRFKILLDGCGWDGVHHELYAHLENPPHVISALIEHKPAHKMVLRMCELVISEMRILLFFHVRGEFTSKCKQNT